MCCDSWGRQESDTTEWLNWTELNVLPLKVSKLEGDQKNSCFWTVVLEKTLESPLDCKEIKPVNPKGNQSWIFIGRTDAEAETRMLWPPDAKNWLTGKDPDAGKDWRQEKKGATEDEMVGMASPTWWTCVWVTLGVGDGQGNLACCSPWGHKESDTTELRGWSCDPVPGNDIKSTEDLGWRGRGRFSFHNKRPARK